MWYKYSTFRPLLVERLLTTSSNSSSLNWFSRLRPVGRRLFHLPGLRALRPFARQVAAVAEPSELQLGRNIPNCDDPGGQENLTVLTANLWHDWPQHRRLHDRLEAFAQLVENEDADIVLLQEVARTSDLHADEWLAERLCMAHVYVRANGHKDGIGFEEGLAILSRFPLSKPRLQQLGSKSSPFVRRMALGAEVDTHLGKVAVFSTHLGIMPRRNASQMAHLRAWVKGIAGKLPALIGGDFNAHENTSQIKLTRRTWLDIFRNIHPKKDGTTFRLRLPGLGALHLRFDYLFLQPGDRRWETLEARHLDAPGGPHSDHRAVMARLAPVRVRKR